MPIRDGRRYDYWVTGLDVAVNKKTFEDACEMAWREKVARRRANGTRVNK